ncbi:MAG: M48 family metallopeptidase [Candidatus Nomurabacteria bacterium]|nr:M48 family metallopeptidase [Candidatus Nomurabacteria bacterium]
MQKTIQLDGKNITYTLKVSKRAKHIRVAVLSDGSIVATIPPYVPLIIVENFIVKKSQWILDKIEYFSKFKGNSFKKGTHLEYLKYKNKALMLVTNRIEYFNNFYGYKWNKIVIRNQSTRWGSCSKNGNLNFNYKIALLPENAADYIIVHELCHLREFNHSHNFWNLVAKTIPDYLDIRRELKSNGFILK